MENKITPSDGALALQEVDLAIDDRQSMFNFEQFTDRLRFLHSLLISPLAAVEDQFQLYLQAGCKMFGTKYGALVQPTTSKVHYSVVDSVSNIFQQREDLLDSVHFYHDASVTGSRLSGSNSVQTAVNLDNLSYNAQDISSYLGTDVSVSGNQFGVLCFFSTSMDGVKFSPQDIETLEMMAEGVARMIELQTAQKKDQSIELGGFATPGVKSLDEYIQQARMPEVFGIPGRVVEVLQRRIGHSPLGIDHIAEELNLSKRTLQRRLQQQSINFAQLRDQVRFHFSIDYLIEQNMSIDGISASLDFSDRTSFTNAFKRWTGLSPSTFRKLFRDYT